MEMSAVKHQCVSQLGMRNSTGIQIRSIQKCCDFRKYTNIKIWFFLNSKATGIVTIFYRTFYLQRWGDSTALMQSKARLRAAGQESGPRSFPNERRRHPIERSSDRESHCLNIERVINLFIYIFIIYKQENSWNVERHKLQRCEMKENYWRIHVSVFYSSVCFLLPVYIPVRIRRGGC